MLTPAHPDFKTLITEKFTRQPFIVLLGIELDKVEAGRIECHLNLQDAHRQNKGFAHGGLIATVADVAAGFAAATLVAANQHVVTVELKISYLHPVVGEELRAVGYVLKPGRKLHFCEAELYATQNGKELLVAKASGTMAVLNPTDLKPTN